MKQKPLNDKKASWILFLAATKAETRDISDFCFFIIGDAYLDFGWSVPKSEFRSKEKIRKNPEKCFFCLKMFCLDFGKLDWI